MARGDAFKGKTKEELMAMRNKNKVTEYGRFKVNDPVKLKIACIEPDHKGKIVKIAKDRNTGEMAAWVDVKSCACRESNGIWGPINFSELEHLK